MDAEEIHEAIQDMEGTIEDMSGEPNQEPKDEP